MSDTMCKGHTYVAARACACVFSCMCLSVRCAEAGNWLQADSRTNLI